MVNTDWKKYSKVQHNDSKRGGCCTTKKPWISMVFRLLVRLVQHIPLKVIRCRHIDSIHQKVLQKAVFPVLPVLNGGITERNDFLLWQMQQKRHAGNICVNGERKTVNPSGSITETGVEPTGMQWTDTQRTGEMQTPKRQKATGNRTGSERQNRIRRMDVLCDGGLQLCRSEKLWEVYIIQAI